jgi:hypothetical protein
MSCSVRIAAAAEPQDMKIEVVYHKALDRIRGGKLVSQARNLCVTMNTRARKRVKTGTKLGIVLASY